MAALYREMDFELDPLFETIISDLTTQDYSVVDHFIDPKTVSLLRNSLLAHFEEDRFKKAAIGSKTNEVIAAAIRGDYILWIDEKVQTQVETLFFKRLNDLVAYLNRTCFLGILQTEFHYALYPTGTGYKRHLDSFQNDNKRKLSIAFYLNSEDWSQTDGGALALYLEGDQSEEQTILVNPIAGRMVIFESQKIPHEVLIAHRDRLSITGWLKTS
ncbi:2OG-Fe(II) oxygenase [Flavobacteriaceae bacterium]|nr:2OG-Fe(II) oxygenase [Flavobacteriaceae bacterium]MDB4047337.1 2OG-Fe(II) oxygenase [Flavobacteriaceae bacterium]